MRLLTSRAAMALAGLLAPALLAAQAPTALKVGDMAPDFTLTAATMKGIAPIPVRLSALRGKTVVLAFFPRAGTSGCTHEMQTYRDQYDVIFGGGKTATLFAISNDSARVTAKWASDSSFQFSFLADVDDMASKLYGSAGNSSNGRKAGDNRDNIIVGPDGKIAAIMRGVLPTDPTSYTQLKEAIAAANKGAKQ